MRLYVSSSSDFAGSITSKMKLVSNIYYKTVFSKGFIILKDYRIFLTLTFQISLNISYNVVKNDMFILAEKVDVFTFQQYLCLNQKNCLLYNAQRESLMGQNDSQKWDKFCGNNNVEIYNAFLIHENVLRFTMRI